MTFGIMTLSIIAFCIMTLSIMTFWIMTLRITSITIIKHYNKNMQHLAN